MGTMDGATLRGRRGALGLSQAGLAQRFGIHVMTISKWERGLNAIPAWVELALAGMVAEAEVTRLRTIVEGAWRFWAAMTSGDPSTRDRGFSMVRVRPEQYAAFDALFRPPSPTTTGAVEES